MIGTWIVSAAVPNAIAFIAELIFIKDSTWLNAAYECRRCR